MKVELVSYSQPLPGITRSVEFQVAFCARVSNPRNQNNGKTAKQLIKYLIDPKHWSPFEMVTICLEIETTRDLARQILRHRSFSFQEFSQRYADPTQELNFEFRDARLQDLTNRQNSLENEDLRLDADWKYRQELTKEHAEDNYRWAIEHGIAKEVARSILPEGNTMSRMYMNGTLRSWIHYIQLRDHEDTQLEHRRIAAECRKVISEIFPMINEL